MELWNFSDINFVIFFITRLVIIVTLIVVGGILLLLYYFEKRYIFRINGEKNTVKIFTIDIKKNYVKYFLRSNIKAKKELDMISFYNGFHPNDVEKVKKWIFDICNDSSKVSEYIEADVLLNKTDTCFSLLKLVKYNEKSGLIHLESHLLKYIDPNNTQKRNNSNKIIASKRSIIALTMSHYKSFKGYTFAIRFFCSRQIFLTNAKIEKYMVMTLKNEVYPFVKENKSNRLLLDNSENELILFDLRINNDQEAIFLASKLEHNFKKCIGINGFSGSISYSIGIVKNSEYYQQFDELISKVQETCMSAQSTDANVLLLHRSQDQSEEIKKYEENINSILKPQNLRFLFRPIVESSNKKIFGYFAYVRAYNSPFTNYLEMCKFAGKVGKGKQLFSTFAKNVICKFASENSVEKAKLFLYVSLADLDYLFDILTQIKETQQIKLVLYFNEQEINENSSRLDLISLAFQKIKEYNFERALLLKDKNLLLDPKFYNNFDYFVAGASMVGEIRKNNRVRLSIHTLIESLLKYKKPIIATDLESWPAIELTIKSGITKVSSECISASHDMLLPVDKKKLDKISEMNDNYIRG